MTDDEYHNIIRYARTRCGKDGIDKVLEENDVDIIMGPGDGPMFTIAGTAGKPSIKTQDFEPLSRLYHRVSICNFTARLP
jgi:hypothetical protein